MDGYISASSKSFQVVNNSVDKVRSENKGGCNELFMILNPELFHHMAIMDFRRSGLLAVCLSIA